MLATLETSIEFPGTANSDPEEYDLRFCLESQEPGFRVWDMANRGQSLGTQRTSRGRIAAIALTPDGRHLAAANADGTIQIWNLAQAFGK
jgi:WD40 repeat protein